MTELKEVEKLFTTKAVAETFDVTAETVRNWIKEGKIGAVKVGNTWRVPKSALIDFANGRHGNTEE